MRLLEKYAIKEILINYLYFTKLYTWHQIIQTWNHDGYWEKTNGVIHEKWFIICKYENTVVKNMGEFLTSKFNISKQK